MAELSDLLIFAFCRMHCLESQHSSFEVQSVSHGLDIYNLSLQLTSWLATTKSFPLDLLSLIRKSVHTIPKSRLK